MDLHCILVDMFIHPSHGSSLYWSTSMMTTHLDMNKKVLMYCRSLVDDDLRSSDFLPRSDNMLLIPFFHHFRQLNYVFKHMFCIFLHILCHASHYSAPGMNEFKVYIKSIYYYHFTILLIKIDIVWSAFDRLLYVYIWL